MITPMDSRKQRMIESLAYCFYLADGCPEGKALQHWLEAQILVDAEEHFEVEVTLEPNSLFNQQFTAA